MSELNDKLVAYENDSLNKIIKDDIFSVDELRKQFNDFMDQQYKKRKDSDDMSIALTGMTNQERYEAKLNNLMNESVNITQQMIDDAKRWSIDSNIYLVYPVNDNDKLDELYNKYNDQHKELRKKADFKCMDLFGMDNHQLYQSLKTNSDVIKYDDNVDYDNFTLANKLLEFNNIKLDKYTDIREANFYKRKILNKIKENYDEENTYKWEFIYAPFFSPKEINELEGFYSEEVIDDSINNIFKEYVNYFYGYENEFNIIEWDSKIRELQYKLEYCDSYNESLILKQSLVKLGWNAELPYNEINQINAISRLNSIINEMYSNFSIVDCTSIFKSFDETQIINESSSKKLYPISIVLIRGDTIFSDIIVKYTKGPFSHAAMCLDDDFTKLYSFDAGGNNLNGIKGGLSLESIKDYPKRNRVAVYTFFVDADTHKAITNNIQAMLYNIKNTKYSILNILTIPFKKINLNQKNNMICSQFVDRMLKLANIDLTNKDSSKVTPNYLYGIITNNSRIYRIYDGPVKDFDFDKAAKFVNFISKNSKPINEEFNILKEFLYNQYLYPIISEARQVPLQFQDNGDLIVNNPLVDFNNEYFSSHKLLLQYEKSKNIDGMKYELARLYYMNYILEKRIYSNKFKINKEKNIKTRARILNDFNKYLAIVLKVEPDFNFAKYYEDSVFYANSVHVTGATLTRFKNMIKYLTLK